MRTLSAAAIKEGAAAEKQLQAARAAADRAVSTEEWERRGQDFKGALPETLSLPSPPPSRCHSSLPALTQAFTPSLTPSPSSQALQEAAAKAVLEAARKAASVGQLLGPKELQQVKGRAGGA